MLLDVREQLTHPLPAFAKLSELSLRLHHLANVVELGRLKLSNDWRGSWPASLSSFRLSSNVSTRDGPPSIIEENDVLFLGGKMRLFGGQR